MLVRRKRNPQFKKGVPNPILLDQVASFVVRKNDASHASLKKEFGLNDQQCRTVLNSLQKKGIVGAKMGPSTPRKVAITLPPGRTEAPVLAGSRGRRPKRKNDVIGEFINLLPALGSALQELCGADDRLNDLLYFIQSEMTKPRRKRGRPRKM